MELSIQDLARQARAAGVPVRQLDEEGADELLVLPVCHDDGILMASMRIQPQGHAILFDVRGVLVIPEALRPEASVLLMDENYGHWGCTWGMDPADGEVTLQTFIPLDGTLPSQHLFSTAQALLNASLRSAFPRLAALGRREGDGPALTPEEAVQSARLLALAFDDDADGDAQAA